MMSRRIDDATIAEVDALCAARGVVRSDFVREALRRQIDRIRAEGEADWIGLDDAAGSSMEAFSAIQSWSPHEDWSDWIDWLDERDGDGETADAPAADEHDASDAAR